MPPTLWHQAGFPEQKRFDCPAAVFGTGRETMFGVSVSVPEEGYLDAVFGPKWRENQKASGGTSMS